MRRAPGYGLLILVCLFAALSIIGLVMELRARTELNLGRQALVHEDMESAATHYSRSLHWYIPWGSAETAAEELLEVGLMLANEEEDEMAMRALLRVRSGLYGARWLVIPRMDLIDRTEPVLAAMLAKQKLGPDAASESHETQRKEYLSLMQRPSQPALLPSLAATFGFLFWVAAAFLFIFRFVGKQGHGWSHAWPWALAWGVGFCLWLLGLKWS